MTTTTPNTVPGGSPNTTGTSNAATKTKAKATLDAKAEKKKRRKKNKNKKKKNNNNNQTRYNGLVLEGIMKDVTISPGSSARMTSDFRLFKKLGAAYAAAKGYEH